MYTRTIARPRLAVFAGAAGASVVMLLLLMASVASDGHVRSTPMKTAVIKPPPEKPVELATPETQRYINGLTDQKRRFVTMLSSAIEDQNQHILAQRRQLLEIFSSLIGGGSLSDADVAVVASIAGEYDIDINQTPDEATWTELFRRVDAIPPSLPLSQSAKESGWGTSRLARENNNYFGERCFERGCGAIPPQRQAGTTHEIADFASVEESVHSYFRNINTHPAYAELRKLRMQMRRQSKPLEGALLADGLHRYSTLGVSYIRDVKSLIRSNKLDKLDQTIIIGGADSRQLLSSAATETSTVVGNNINARRMVVR
jgi:Bax protein